MKWKVPDQEYKEDLETGCAKRLPDTQIEQGDAMDRIRWRK